MNVVYEISMGPYKQIGSTCRLNHRMNCHVSALKKNKHWNSMMQNVWNKHQIFEYKILSQCPEQRLNVSKAHIKNKMSILQYDLDGILIKEWDSIQELKDKFQMGNILRCCKGRRNSAYKYKWKFKE